MYNNEELRTDERLSARRLYAAIIRLSEDVARLETLVRSLKKTLEEKQQ